MKRLAIMFIMAGIALACKKEDDDTITSKPIPPQPSKEEVLTETLASFADSAYPPGFAVTIVKNGEISYQKSFGVRSIAPEKEFENETLIPIGSISKTFVGTALVKAISMGYFDLQTPISEILPIPVFNPRFPDDSIRIIHLATHTSGLLDVDEIYDATYRIFPGQPIDGKAAQMLMNDLDIEQREALDLDEIMEAVYSPQSPYYTEESFATTSPGEAYHYSNLASSLAAFCIEVATEMDYADFLDQYVLQPLKMHQTKARLSDANLAQVSSLFLDNENIIPFYETDSYPDGGITTNNIEMGLYLQDLIAGATGKGNTIFNASHYDILFEQQTNHSGIFWEVDGTEISHTGSDFGVNSLIYIDRITGNGFSIISNADASTDENEIKWITTQESMLEAMGVYFKN